MSMPDGDITEVLEMVRKGEVDHFAGVVREFQQDVWRVVAFYVRDMSAIEDVVQEVFVTAFREFGRFRAGGDFGAWLKGIARNLARRAARRTAVKSKLFGQYLDHMDGIEGRGTADERMDVLADALEKCREKLPGPAIAALTMRYEQGRDFDEIAAETGRTVSAARQFLQRVRDSLRLCIEKRMGEIWTG